MKRSYLHLLLVLIISALLSPMASAQTDPQHSEEDLIRATIQKYIDGSSYNNPELIAEAFYEGADLFLNKPGQDLFLMSVDEYANIFAKREKGKFNGRTGNILSVDRHNDIATATAEILIASNNSRYIDMFLLKRLGGTWKIVSKAATLMPTD